MDAVKSFKILGFDTSLRLKVSYRGNKGPEQCFRVPTILCSLGDSYGEHKEKKETFSTDCQQETAIDLKLPRRSLLITFTCDACGARSQRLINRLAYERGLVYVQCSGCSQYHKLVDNLGLVIEYNLQEEIDVDANVDQVGEGAGAVSSVSWTVGGAGGLLIVGAGAGAGAGEGTNSGAGTGGGIAGAGAGGAVGGGTGAVTTGAGAGAFTAGAGAGGVGVACGGGTAGGKAGGGGGDAGGRDGLTTGGLTGGCGGGVVGLADGGSGGEVVGVTDGVATVAAGGDAAAGVVGGGAVVDGVVEGEAAGAWAFTVINKMQRVETQAHRNVAILELIRDACSCSYIYISRFGSRRESLVICHDWKNKNCKFDMNAKAALITLPSVVNTRLHLINWLQILLQDLN
ncbi:Zim17-type zinc finger protein [Perilla frutescens var. hirtella]|nr:Zim17-type zinc finger protein [Perilla frutescens var. hirtella]KAH6805422.1 Zim17-type zinc finger protein [Perilla frutescens var. frutescens]